MQVTEVRVSGFPKNGEHQGPKESPEKKSSFVCYLTVVLEGDYVLHDVKVVRGREGNIYLSMPSKKYTDACQECGWKNVFAARFCSGCGKELGYYEARKDPKTGHPLLEGDVFHPVSREARQRLEEQVLEDLHRQHPHLFQDGERGCPPRS